MLLGSEADFCVSASASFSFMESHNSLQPCCLLGRTTRYKECESSKDNLLAPVSPRHQKPDLESVEGNARISKNLASDEVSYWFFV